MAKQSINRGSSANDGTGDNLRVGAGKVNDNFDEIYTAFGDGTTITSGTFITDVGTHTLTNKSIDLTDNTVTGTLAEFNTAVTDATLVSTAGSETLTNKTINGPDNTITNIVNANLSGSAAISNANLANSSISIGGISLNLGDTDATPAFNLSDAFAYPTSSLSGTITNAQLAGSIVNSKLSNSAISIIADDSSAQSIALGGSILFTGGSGITTSISGNEISFVTDGSIVTETSTDTLTNKTINGPDNTLTNIANASLANSGVTLGATSVALGGTAGSASNFNLSGTSSISGSGTVDTTGAGNKLRFNVAAVDAAALGSAIDPTTYEGMFAYNTTDNQAYVADTGGWTKLINENASVGDLSNVDLSGIANGNVLTWDSGDAKFVAGSSGGFSAGSDLDQAGADVQDVGYVSHRSPDATVTQTLTVTVATKTSEHTAFGDGSSSGYLIDGHEGAHLQLTPGVYKFDQADSSNSGHPLRFYDVPGKTTLYSTGVTTAGTPGSAGAHTTITITKATPSTLHYQCTAHATMGGVVSVLGSEATRITSNLRLSSSGNSAQTRLSVGDDDVGSVGATGKLATFSQDLSTTFAGGSVGTIGGINIINNDETSNRTASGITLSHRSSSSGISYIASTSTAADRADLRFGTRGSDGINERMQLADNGDLFLNTTSKVNASIANIYFSRTTHDGLGLETDSASIAYAMIFRNTNGLVGSISMESSATSFNTSSDHRLKENVNYTWDATTRLKQLKPARFSWINGDSTLVDGFLAHEVSSAVPEAITGTHNGVEVWKDGEELPEGVSVGDNKLDGDGNTIPVYQGIDQSKLVPLLVKTIQELEARITTLENA